MSSSALGETSSGPEVTHISSHGVWVLAEGHEYFMSYENFPWFKDATLGKILHLEMPSQGHLYWPELDVDLTVDMIEHPERFPLEWD